MDPEDDLQPPEPKLKIAMFLGALAITTVGFWSGVAWTAVTVLS